MFAARFKPVSNLADWQTMLQLTDRDTGQLLDLTGGSTPLTWSIDARLQDTHLRPLRPWLSASSNDGSGALTIPGLGLLQIYFPVASMQALEPGSYVVTLLVTNGIFTRQIWGGLLPIVGRQVSIGQGYSLGGSFYG